MKKIDRIKIYNKYAGHCAYCGVILNLKNMQVDHIIPKSNYHYYKEDGKVNDLENLNPSCRRCNHYKRSLSLEQFRERINTIHERIVKIYIAKVAIDFGIIKVQQWSNEFFFEWYDKLHESNKNKSGA